MSRDKKRAAKRVIKQMAAGLLESLVKVVDVRLHGAMEALTADEVQAVAAEVVADLRGDK